MAIEQAKNMQAKALIPATIKFEFNPLIKGQPRLGSFTKFFPEDNFRLKSLKKVFKLTR